MTNEVCYGCKKKPTCKFVKEDMRTIYCEQFVAIRTMRYRIIHEDGTEEEILKYE